jgi:hypothetical protein
VSASVTKREVLLHLSREKKLEPKERISLRLKNGFARDDAIEENEEGRRCVENQSEPRPTIHLSCFTPRIV